MRLRRLETVDWGVSAAVHAVMDLTTSHTLLETFWRAWVDTQDINKAVEKAVKEEINE